MALKLNSQPRKPSGPLRDSSRYTSRPTTTDGNASNVLSTVSTLSRPVKRVTPSQAPNASPKPHPIRQAVPLTASERPTTVHRPGSNEAISANAVEALSDRVDMGGAVRHGSGIVGTRSIPRDMFIRA